MGFFLGGVGILFAFCLLMGVIVWLEEVSSDIRESRKLKSRKDYREQLKRTSNEVAREIIYGERHLAVEDVFDNARECSSQFTLLEHHPKAWATAVLQGYMEELCEQSGMSFAPSYDDNEHTYTMNTIEELWDASRIDYLRHLHRYAYALSDDILPTVRRQSMKNQTA